MLTRNRMGLDCNTEKLKDARIQWDPGDSNSERKRETIRVSGASNYQGPTWVTGVQLAMLIIDNLLIFQQFSITVQCKWNFISSETVTRLCTFAMINKYSIAISLTQLCPRGVGTPSNMRTVGCTNKNQIVLSVFIDYTTRKAYGMKMSYMNQNSLKNWGKFWSKETKFCSSLRGVWVTRVRDTWVLLYSCSVSRVGSLKL